MLASTIDPAPTATETSLQQLYLEQSDRLRGYLQRIVGDRATAEDLVHDTFLKALGAWSARDPLASPSAWLYRIAINTAYDELRPRRRARAASLTEEATPGVAVASVDGHIADQDAMRRALAEVPAVYRTPLFQVYGGRRVDEIATQLDVAVGKVKSRLHRARAYVRRAYVDAASA